MAAQRSVPVVLGGVILIAGGLLTLLLLSGGEDGAGSSEKTKPLRVALLTPGSINDGGWNAIAYKGLLRIRDELGATIAHREGKPSPENIEQDFSLFVQKDFRIIFGHGFEYNAPAVELGKKYTDTYFIASSGARSESPNVGYFRFLLEESTYCLGYLAAKMSKTKQLGCVGGVEIPPVKSTFNAFASGARAADPAVRVRQVYTGSWSDIPAAKRMTTALLSGGVDLIFHNCNDGFPGVIDAVRERRESGALLFGANDDQSAMAPELILASAVLDIPKSFVLLAREIQSGTFRGGARRVGMADGVVWIAYNEKLAARIPPALKAEVDALAARIKSGKMSIAVDDLK